MSIAKLGRAVLSYGVGLSLALQGLGALVPTTVRAAIPDLRISEINWAGSATDPTDQWIEFVNAGTVPILFSNAEPYTLTIGTDSYSLGSSVGELAAGQYLLIQRNAPASSSVDLVPSAVQLQMSDLVLPTVPARYQLFNGTGSLVDEIGDGNSSVPFAGQAASGPTKAASMSRISLLSSGSDAANWYTAQTIGVGFRDNAPEQYGTPGKENLEVAQPTGTITPSYSTTVDIQPVVSGATGLSATEVWVRFTAADYETGSRPATYVFSGTVTGQSYEVATVGISAGKYTVLAWAYDIEGNRSQRFQVPAAPGSLVNQYLVIPTSSSVPAPVLDPLPTITNQPDLQVSGSLVTPYPYRELEVLRNGAYYTTVPFDGPVFSFPFILEPNLVNEIQVIAVSETGAFSVPATATVEHDNIAPNPTDVQKVVVTPSAPGADDLIKGLPSAAEPHTTLYVYGDTALTISLGTATVEVDGSFPQLSIGDNLYEHVYLVLEDAAGNRSAAAVVHNPHNFVVPGGLNPVIISLNSTEVTVGWSESVKAVKYQVKYRLADESFGEVMEVCVTGNAFCSFQTTIKGLGADTNYVFAIAAVDYYGNVSAFEEVAFRTKVAPVVTPSTGPIPAIGGAVGIPIVAPTTSDQEAAAPGAFRSPRVASRIQPTPVLEPTPTPASTPDVAENGEVSGEATTRNWTPWIVLGILIALAALATAGYFYWFGGQAGEAALASVMAARAARDEEAAATKAEKKKVESKRSSNTKTKGKDRRW
jgi:hypothetical protein